MTNKHRLVGSNLLKHNKSLKRNTRKWALMPYDAQDGKKALMPYANSEDPDKFAHPCSLIWTFSVCRHILQYLLILLADNAGPDQPAHSRRLIRTCVVRKLHKGLFHALRILQGQADQGRCCTLTDSIPL